MIMPCRNRNTDEAHQSLSHLNGFSALVLFVRALKPMLAVFLSLTVDVNTLCSTILIGVLLPSDVVLDIKAESAGMDIKKLTWLQRSLKLARLWLDVEERRNKGN